MVGTDLLKEKQITENILKLQNISDITSPPPNDQGKAGVCPKCYNHQFYPHFLITRGWCCFKSWPTYYKSCP